MLKDYEIGNRFVEDLVLTATSLRKTKTNKDFLVMTFTDGESTLSGNIWDYKTERGIPATNTIYTVNGSIGEYNGARQLTITSANVATDQDMSRFACTYGPAGDGTELLSMLSGWIANIENPTLNTIAYRLYSEYADIMSNATAAKHIHHVGKGGWLHHTLDTVELAVAIAKSLQNMYAMPISLPLVIAGAAVHDIGKLCTYKMQGAFVEMTTLGALEEHIVVGINLVNSTIASLEAKEAEIDYNAVVLLKHIIASHHEKLEYGSPVMPKCLEAFIVSMADKISSTADIVLTANNAAGADPLYTDKCFAMGNCVLLRQRIVDEWLNSTDKEAVTP